MIRQGGSKVSEERLQGNFSGAVLSRISHGRWLGLTVERQTRPPRNTGARVPHPVVSRLWPNSADGLDGLGGVGPLLEAIQTWAPEDLIWTGRRSPPSSGQENTSMSLLGVRQGSAPRPFAGSFLAGSASLSRSTFRSQRS